MFGSSEFEDLHSSVSDLIKGKKYAEAERMLVAKLQELPEQRGYEYVYALLSSCLTIQQKSDAALSCLEDGITRTGDAGGLLRIRLAAGMAAQRGRLEEVAAVLEGLAGKTLGSLENGELEWLFSELEQQYKEDEQLQVLRSKFGR